MIETRLLVILVLAVSGCSVGETKLKLPLNLPVDLSRAGVVAETNFTVDELNVYDFFLEFYYQPGNELDRTRVRKVLGGNALDKTGAPLEPGVTTPVRLEIFKLGENYVCRVFQKQLSPTLTSWGGDSFGKNIGGKLLFPGTYHLRLESLSGNPAYASIKTDFVVGMDRFKTTVSKNMEKVQECLP
ncbi:DUF5625 family protein [Chromobacterium haemolyticum]|uniref:DUF5625 family protein n=1 Tax=Chromobacterium haemolyticum TaxID=394935 RepID=UPI0011B28340|nr:DUF5625 family protein [Chromobacterium haemolyticum]